MRTPSVRPILVTASLLAAGLTSVCFPPLAPAQTTTSQSALDALGPSSKTRPVHHGVVHARSHTARSRPAAATRHVSSHAPAATIPAGPPPPPVFVAPVITVPLHPPPPPPPVPVVQTAAGAVTPIDSGVRIGFGAGSADLNPATMQALHDFAAQVKAAPDMRAILDAAAAGSPDDPSTPRRLALSRGLAARAVLINDGIASTRIYVRMNPRADAGADHVDLHLESNDATTTPPPGPAPP